MNSAQEREIPVLSVGAGPTGLVLALWMARLGVRVRIIDKTKEAGRSLEHQDFASRHAEPLS